MIRILFLELSLFLIFAGHCDVVLAQPATLAEQRYDEAVELMVWKGQGDESREKLAQVADEFAGTPWAALALQRLAQWTPDAVQRRAYLQRVIDEYPGSEYAFISSMDVLKSDYFQDVEGWFREANLLATGLGGPPFEQVLTAPDRTALTAQVQALPFEAQWRLYTLYDLACEYTSGELFGRHDPARGLPMAFFLRETFETTGIAPAGAGNIFVNLRRLTGESSAGYGTKTVDPTVDILAPLQNSTTGPVPDVIIEITVGDYQHLQTDLSKLEVTLDGESLKPGLEIRTQVATSLQVGVPFEELSLKAKPSQPLASGQHVLSVIVPVQGYSGTGSGRTEVTRTFTVASTPPPDPTTQTLPTTKDSILSAQNPHRNEGANPLLQLSHRPEERNKANNPIVAFDLSNVNVSTVTKATLLLDVQECDLPKKWGSEGRNILAYPVNQTWVEGNGETLKVGQGEKTRGTGQGVTWFSPIDENIANKAPNGSVQWMGARPFLGPLTAPAVRVVNKQTGSISFDVTQDLKSGFEDGWLVRKQDESAFGNIRFFSKEGASTSKAPRLVLEYGGPTAMTRPEQIYSAVAGFFGFTKQPVSLQASSGAGEGSRSLRKLLRGSPRSAFVGEQVVLGFVGGNPLTELGARVVYRSWLRETPSLV